MSNEIKDQVQHIINTIEQGFEGYLEPDEYGDIRGVMEYLQDVLDLSLIHI